MATSGPQAVICNIFDLKVSGAARLNGHDPCAYRKDVLERRAIMFEQIYKNIDRCFYPLYY